MALGYYGNLISSQVDGPALAGAAAVTAIPAAAKRKLRANFFDFIGKQIIVRAWGRISCAVTTPGTARFDFRLGGTVVMDSLAMPLNIVAKTDTPFELLMVGTVRNLGTAAQLHWQGHWLSAAAINTAAIATGPGPGGFLLPYNSAPALGTAFDSTIEQVSDCFFTQTVATGTMTIHQYSVDCPNLGLDD